MHEILIASLLSALVERVTSASQLEGTDQPRMNRATTAQPLNGEKNPTTVTSLIDTRDAPGLARPLDSHVEGRHCQEGS